MNEANLTGWEVMVDAGGNILQSGARSQPLSRHHNAEDTRGWITRGVVLQVYFADEDTRIGATQRCVQCDVRTFGRYSRVLKRVPVLQRAHGLHDHDIYVPRPATLTLDGSPITSEPTATSGPTPAENIDGDHVLVGFLDNDPSQPVILPMVMPHPQSSYSPMAASGRERRIQHSGTVITWSPDGALTIDATGAASQQLGAKGVEVPAPANITVKTLGAVRVDDGAGDFLSLSGSVAELSAPLVQLATGPREPVIKATTFNASTSALYTLLTTYFAAAATAWAEIAAKGAAAPMSTGTPAATAAGAWAAGVTKYFADAAVFTSAKVEVG